MKKGRRIARWWLIGAAATVILAAMVFVSLMRSTSIGGGRFMIVVRSARIEVAWCTTAIKQKGPVWTITTPQMAAGVMVAPKSVLFPSIARADVSVGSSALLTTYTLKVAYVPLPIWAIAAGGLTALLWLWAPRRHVNGHCTACGYNLAGLVSGTCPECGEQVTLRFISWLIRCTASRRAGARSSC